MLKIRVFPLKFFTWNLKIISWKRGLRGFRTWKTHHFPGSSRSTFWCVPFFGWLVYPLFPRDLGDIFVTKKNVGKKATSATSTRTESPFSSISPSSKLLKAPNVWKNSSLVQSFFTGICKFLNLSRRKNTFFWGDMCFL